MDGQNRLPRTRRTFLWAAALSLAAAGMGCGGGKAGTKISGTVKYQGKPLPSGTVTFFDAKKEIVGSASIKDGSYAVEGVPPGKAMVTVTTPPAVRPDPNHPPPKDMPGGPPLPVVPVPPQYGNPEKSGLSYDVKAGKQEFPIELR